MTKVLTADNQAEEVQQAMDLDDENLNSDSIKTLINNIVQEKTIALQNEVKELKKRAPKNENRGATSAPSTKKRKGQGLEKTINNNNNNNNKKNDRADAKNNATKPASNAKKKNSKNSSKKKNSNTTEKSRKPKTKS